MVETLAKRPGESYRGNCLVRLQTSLSDSSIMTHLHVIDMYLSLCFYCINAGGIAVFIFL